MTNGTDAKITMKVRSVTLIGLECQENFFRCFGSKHPKIRNDDRNVILGFSNGIEERLSLRFRV
jgi:hypothetical protein